MNYTVAIVGRPNVGKSTFFNRLTESKKAIVEDIAGVTRDRLYEKVVYKEKTFNLIDTGGITLEEGTFNEEIKMQAEIAIDEADVILFVVDGKSNLTSEEEMIGQMLRKQTKPVLVIANKVDNMDVMGNIYEYYQLGFEKVIPVSSIHGSGSVDVLEEIYPLLPEYVENDSNEIKFSLIGRPNVGKSSLFNALIKEERSIVSEVEGTTRDAVDYRFTQDDQAYCIVDTAGIKKRGKVYEKVDKYSVLRSLKSIESSDIVLWLIDADRGVVEQDKRVAGYALNENKPIIVIINKWDLVAKETNTQKLYLEKLKAEMPFIADSQFLFLSALTSRGVDKIIPTIDVLYKKYSVKYTTSQVNNVLNDAVSSKIHPTHKGKPVRFYYATQVGNKPPKFLVFVNNAELVHFSYARYLENYFKKAFGLNGIKLVFSFRNKKQD